MSYVHHKPIKKFGLSGIIHDDAHIVRLKAEYVRLLWTSMKLSGYVPRLDIDLNFTTSYNEDARYFEFELSVYGIYVGKRKSEWIIGIDGSKVIHTHQIKSNESLRARA
tara:strand:- start:7324 stop:7650 length:327 start_codon:yes stop_codon:yes gene_type:complete